MPKWFIKKLIKLIALSWGNCCKLERLDCYNCCKDDWKIENCIEIFLEKDKKQ